MLRTILGLFIVIVLVAAIWIGGIFTKVPQPYLIWATVAVVGLFLLIAGSMKLYAIMRSLKIEKQLQAQSQKQAQAPGGNQSAAKEMQDQFSKSLSALKASQPGKGALYALPWYMVLGVPGSGKTTVLQESGLSFSTLGQGARSIRGIGGTRNCDWWFTEQAIFLDTAGRYTSEAQDQPEWLNFLDLLERNRRGKPINGAIVTVSVPDLIKKDNAGIEREAQTLRDRLDELRGRLNVVFPVYVVFTKCDFIGGFKDFFAGLSRQDKDQVWGATLPWHASAANYQEVFQQECQRMLPSIQAKRLAVLAGGRSDEQLKKTLQFPVQFVVVQRWMGEFLGALFRPNPMKESAVLRGFYFTSGTQANVLAKTADAAGSRLPFGDTTLPGAKKPAAPVEAAMDAGQSFFLTPGALKGGQGSSQVEVPDQRSGIFLKSLFTKVIIPDQGLVRSSSQVVQRNRLVGALSHYGAIAIGALLALYLIGSLFGKLSMVSTSKAEVRRALDVEQQNSTIAAKLSSLEIIRANLAGILASGSAPERLTEMVRELYLGRLSKLLRTPAAERVKMELDNRSRPENDGTVDIEALTRLVRSYRMLGGLAKDRDFDPKLLVETLKENNRWVDNSLDPASKDIAGKQLDFLASQLGDSEHWKIEVDLPLIKKVTELLIVHQQIPNEYKTIIEALAKTSTKVRATVLPQNGKGDLDADYDFPSLFTAKERDKVTTYFTASSENLSAEFRKLGVDKSPGDIVRLFNDLYAKDYNNHWLTLLGSARLHDLSDLRDGSRKLESLADNDSAYKKFVADVYQALSESFLEELLRNRVLGKIEWTKEVLDIFSDLFKTTDKFLKATDAKKRSQDVKALEDLDEAFDKSWERLKKVVGKQVEMERQAAVLQGLQGILRDVFTGLSNEIREEQDRLWGEKVYAVFKAQFAAKRPFVETAETDVPLNAFGQMFNPKSGEFGKRVEVIEKLRSLKFLDAQLLPITRAYEAARNRAQDYRDVFFAKDSESFNVGFALKIIQQPNIKDIDFRFGETTFNLYETPTFRKDFQWKEGGAPVAQITISTLAAEKLNLDFTESAWAPLRLLRAGKPAANAGGGYLCTWVFQSEKLGRNVNYEVQAQIETKGLEKAFAAGFFSEFVCPQTVSQ